MILEYARAEAILAALITVAWPTAAPTQSIEVGPIVQVSPSGTGHHWFTSITAAPDDSLHLMACGIRQQSRQNTWQGFVYISDDRGRNWSVGMVDSSSLNVSEETCTFGLGGRAYFIAQPWSRDWDVEHSVLHFYRSRDHGKSWLGPVSDRWLDYARMAVDNSEGSYAGRVYVIGNRGWRDTSKFSSKETFSSADGYVLGPRVMVPAASGYRVWGNYPQHALVLKDGTVLGAYWSRMLPSDGDTSGAKRWFGIEIIRSTDGGRTFDPPVLAARSAGRRDLIPALASYDGRAGTVVVLAWSDSAGGRSRVHFSRSLDAGKNWSPPVLIDDAPAVPPGDDRRGRDAVWAGLAANRNGVIGVTWVEQRLDCWRFSASLDGGRSFLPSVPLNRCPRQTPAGAESYGDYLWAVPNIDSDEGGRDTSRTGITVRYWDVTTAGPPGVVADAAGAFHPLWALPRDQGRLWTTTVRVSPVTVVRPKARVQNLIDVTSRVAFTITDLQYDYAAGVLRLNLSLLNHDSLPLRAPLIVRGGPVASALGSVAALEPDGVDDGRSLWDFSNLLTGGMLRPQEESGPRQLTFSMVGFPAPKGPGIDWNDAWRRHFLTVELKVYADQQAASNPHR